MWLSSSRKVSLCEHHGKLVSWRIQAIPDVGKKNRLLGAVATTVTTEGSRRLFQMGLEVCKAHESLLRT
jgi:hypothetical protein